MIDFLHIGDLHYGFDDYTPKIVETFIQDLPDCDVLLISGDIISHKQDQWDAVLKLIHEKFQKSLKIMVMGNHDYWGMSNYQKDMNEVMRLLKQYKIFNIELQGQPLIIDNDNAIFGFSGWYSSQEPPSSDMDYIPKYLLGKEIDKFSTVINFHDIFYRRALAKKDEICQLLPHYKKSVILTHFEPNTHPMGSPEEWIMDFRQHEQERLILCCGHSHCFNELHDKAFTLYNHGSDYNNPRYIEFKL